MIQSQLFWSTIRPPTSTIVYFTIDNKLWPDFHRPKQIIKIYISSLSSLLTFKENLSLETLKFIVSFKFSSSTVNARFIHTNNHPYFFFSLPTQELSSSKECFSIIPARAKLFIFILEINHERISWRTHRMYTTHNADEKRSCTDWHCCILFFGLTVFMLAVGIYAWTNPNGNFKKLTTAYDPDGKGCGLDYPKFPYIYFASPHSDVKSFSTRAYGWQYACRSVP